MSRYQVIRVVGHGPDGPVEEVRPDRLGGAPLARRRSPVPAGPRRHRLREGAEALARLGHPGIATVVDLVEVDDEAVEVLTTLGDGSWADQAGLAPGVEVRDLLLTLADALAAAHGVGVTHGHVVVGNVVRHDGRPLLTDFGMAEARTGRLDAEPFRRDVADLAALGLALLDPAEASPVAAALRPLLRWAADDPDATLADLRRGLTQAVAPPPPPPPAPPAPEPTAVAAGSPRRGTLVVAGMVALAVGLLVGAGVTLLPTVGTDGGPEVGDVADAPADTAPCTPVDAAMRADVDGDGCDEPLEWQADAAELAYPTGDGTPLRFRIGRPGDELVVGDWDCDGTATAAVVRPGTGQTFLFDGWAGPDETLTAQTGPEVPAGAEVEVVDDGGCDRIRAVGV